MSPPVASQLFTGSVMHRRLRPVGHHFTYPVFFLRLQLSTLDSAGNSWFSLNRFNLASFHYRDHGARDGSHPLAWIRSVLASEGIQAADGEVWLQCFPRVLGYVFNPVSFWFCHDRGGSLRAILAEVSNTFGERHHYLLAHPCGRPIVEDESLEVRKVFHVSPFFPVAGRYAFRFESKGALERARIDYLDDAGQLLLTCLSGRAEPLTAGSVLRAVLAHPLMTLGVMARIHWQAAKLLFKRLPFFPKPPAPLERVSR